MRFIAYTIQNKTRLLKGEVNMFIIKLGFSIALGLIVIMVLLNILKYMLFSVVLFIEGKPVESYLNQRKFKKKLKNLDQIKKR